MAQIYNANVNLKAANVAVQFTPEQVQEWIKCANDPIYFIETYCKIVSLDHGLIPFKLYDCQRDKVNVRGSCNKTTLDMQKKYFAASQMVVLTN